MNNFVLKTSLGRLLVQLYKTCSLIFVLHVINCQDPVFREHDDKLECQCCVNVGLVSVSSFLASEQKSFKNGGIVAC